ncbi:MAG: ABC transporter ATP-binding protein, partial [Planctomycetales bacterium]|nr:ABC transporter ATP-binding protein [Planctomycetales bacterium]
ALPPALRGIGYVPQDGALFPTMTVEDQIGFALYVRRRAPQEIAARVRDLAEMLEIPHLLRRYPQHLSGGEAQRVALGRALAFHPHVLLLDEPLSALDPQTREHMYLLIKRIRQQTRITAIHVTHSQQEAEALADVVLTLDRGQVQCRATGDQSPVSGAAEA